MKRTLVAGFTVSLTCACGGITTGKTSPGDSGGSSGKPPVVDPCATSAQSACEGDVLLTCDKGTVTRFDCASGIGQSRICTWLGGSVSAFSCAARIGDECYIHYQGDPVVLDCAGDESGCIQHHDQTSECVEHLVQCPPALTSGRQYCVGTYWIDACNLQPPLGRDCADFGSDARCVEAGDQARCENIPEGNPCNAAWDGTDSFAVSLELRCAPGGFCIDASLSPDGLGTCRNR